MSHPNEHPLLKSARREAIATLVIWVIVTTYSFTYCWKYGYLRPATAGVADAAHLTGRDPASLTFVLGFPDWVFWGIVLPWLSCTVVSGLFAFCFMKDEDLDS